LNVEKINIILATDCGSTTTKARLFKKFGNEYRFICTGEAPTTVEAPFEDVTMGVRNAVREIEELIGRKLLSEDGIILRSSQEMQGVDLYVTTSSAGGGLQMMVFGSTKSITGESAERAALGGGAIVMDVMTLDDGKPLHDRIERTRFLRPDMILLSGGTDGGDLSRAVQSAEIIAVADPKARFGEAYNLPIIYAGNKDARSKVNKLLADKFSLQITENIRPDLGLENTDPARDAIQLLFMEHVMSHAPGYDRLMTWTEVPIMPTPRGEGTMFQTVIGVGLGGATTNVYSVFDGKFVRTVSANLGMSYSICNVLKETGIDNILRWIPFDISKDKVVDILSNKMIRPTTIPQTLRILIIEHAVAREALRLGFLHHKFLARGLRGVQRTDEVVDMFTVKVAGSETYIDMLNIDLIGGTGGLLSHAPERVQSMLVLIDGFQPEGVTRLVQDSVFMMPHLGVLSTIHPTAALEIFEKDCLVQLGTCIAPRGVPEKESDVGEWLKVEFTMPDGSVKVESLDFGEIRRLSLPTNEVRATITPQKSCDVGSGPGRSLTCNIRGGVVGVVIDARGRPLILPQERDAMKKTILTWLRALEVYPEIALERYGKGDD
jgi:uncharacterized protein (TIGR01319 family)